MRKDVLWLVALLVVVGVGVRLAQSRDDTDEVGSAFEWTQTFKSGDRWTFAVTRTADGAEIQGNLVNARGQKVSKGRLTSDDYHGLMDSLSQRNAWSLASTRVGERPPWLVTYRIGTPSRRHFTEFDSTGATPEHLALARYIDMENPITSSQLREFSKGERAIWDALLGFFNDVLNSMVGPPP